MVDRVKLHKPIGVVHRQQQTGSAIVVPGSWYVLLVFLFSSVERK